MKMHCLLLRKLCSGALTLSFLLLASDVSLAIPVTGNNRNLATQKITRPITDGQWNEREMVKWAVMELISKGIDPRTMTSPRSVMHGRDAVLFERTGTEGDTVTLTCTINTIGEYQIVLTFDAQGKYDIAEVTPLNVAQTVSGQDKGAGVEGESQERPAYLQAESRSTADDMRDLAAQIRRLCDRRELDADARRRINTILDSFVETVAGGSHVAAREALRKVYYDIVLEYGLSWTQPGMQVEMMFNDGAFSMGESVEMPTLAAAEDWGTYDGDTRVHTTADGEEMPYAQWFVPRDEAHRAIGTVTDALRVALSPGKKLIVTEDRAQMTELTVAVTVALSLLIDGPWNFGIATGGTSEHGRKALGMPAYLNEALKEVDWAALGVQQERLANGVFDWSRIGTVGTLDDYLWTVNNLYRLYTEYGRKADEIRSLLAEKGMTPEQYWGLLHSSGFSLLEMGRRLMFREQVPSGLPMFSPAEIHRLINVSREMLGVTYRYEQMYLLRMPANMRDPERQFISPPLGADDADLAAAARSFHDRLQNHQFLVQIWGIGTPRAHAGFIEGYYGDDEAHDRVVNQCFLMMIQNHDFYVNPVSDAARAPEIFAAYHGELPPIYREFGGAYQVGVKENVQEAVAEFKIRMRDELDTYARTGVLPAFLADLPAGSKRDALIGQWNALVDEATFEAAWQYVLSVTVERFPRDEEGNPIALTQGYRDNLARGFFHIIPVGGTHKTVSTEHTIGTVADPTYPMSMVFHLAQNSVAIVQRDAMAGVDEETSGARAFYYAHDASAFSDERIDEAFEELSPYTMFAQRVQDDAFGLASGESQEAGTVPLRILIADDEPTIRELNQAFAEIWSEQTGMPVEVVTAADGAQALALIEAGRFDVVITDNTMPGMQGSALAQRVKEISPRTFVALASGDPLDRTPALKEAVDAGWADQFIAKPYGFEQVLGTLSTAQTARAAQGGSVEQSPEADRAVLSSVRLLIVGPPGSGKGTHAQLLREQYGLEHVSTGDLLRAEVAAASPLGREARGYMDRGELVPDELVLRIVTNWLDTRDHQRGFILDGFPRTVAQAGWLSDTLAERGLDLNGVINIEVPDEVLDQRTVRRAEERRQQGLEPRADDTLETARVRRQEFLASTVPVLAFYRTRGRVEDVDLSSDDLQENFSRIHGALWTIAGSASASPIVVAGDAAAGAQGESVEADPVVHAYQIAGDLGVAALLALTRAAEDAAVPVPGQVIVRVAAESIDQANARLLAQLQENERVTVEIFSLSGDASLVGTWGSVIPPKAVPEGVIPSRANTLTIIPEEGNEVTLERLAQWGIAPEETVLAVIGPAGTDNGGLLRGLAVGLKALELAWVQAVLPGDDEAVNTAAQTAADELNAALSGVNGYRIAWQDLKALAVGDGDSVAAALTRLLAARPAVPLMPDVQWDIFERAREAFEQAA